MQYALRDFFGMLRTVAGSTDSPSKHAPEPETPRPVFIGSMVINILALALPITILQVYDRVLPNASFSTLNALIIGLIVVVSFDLVLKYARSHLVNWAGASYTHRVSTKALGVILNGSRDNTPVAEHLDRLAAINGIGNHIGGLSRVIKIDMLFIPVFAGIIFIVGGPLVLIPLLLFTIFGYLSFHRTLKLRQVIKERELTDSRKNDFLIEVFSAIPTVKAIAMEPSMLRRYERLQLHASNVVQQLIVLTNAAQTFGSLFTAMSTISIVGIGAILVIKGGLTMGGLACCMLLSSQLIQPLTKILSAWNEIQLTAHYREKVDNIFEHAPTATSSGHVQTTKIETPASISFKDVTIRYGDATPLFQRLHLNIAPGEIIAFRGSDGSGRSSLLRAINGGTLPAAGSVELDGVPVSYENNGAIRSAVRYVAQEPALFRGTILENLTIFGKTPVKNCLWASKLIGLDEIIIRMPMGYDTQLEGAAGQDIPASTSQRICIARALALKPSVIIFDEANTALDLPGEKAFMAALEELRGRMTIILSTHRPSLLRQADRAFEVGDGQVLPLSTVNNKKHAGVAS